MKKDTHEKRLILLKSEDNSCLIEAVFKFHYTKDTDKVLILSNKEKSFIQDSIDQIKVGTAEYTDKLNTTRFMFLKQSWKALDEMYGKTFFINEIQKIMKEEEFSILYFHRADTFFEGCSKRDLERIVSDISEVARYYHKVVIFSLGEFTRLGKIMDDVFYKEIDVEYFISKDMSGKCQSKMLNIKKEYTKVILFSDKPDVVKFHEYIFKKDSHIHFKHITNLDENQQDVEEADIILYNIHNVPFKDKLLNIIKNRKLRTKFLYLSNDSIIRKRDKVRKIEKGITYVFEKNFDILEYIYTIEKSVGREFYTTILDKVNVLPHNHYLKDEDILKDSVYSFLNYHIYFCMVAVEYSEQSNITMDIIDNSVRDLDFVYHNEDNRNLIFLLVDILPEYALELIVQRLGSKNIKIVSQRAFDVDECQDMMGITNKSISAVEDLQK